MHTIQTSSVVKVADCIFNIVIYSFHSLPRILHNKISAVAEMGDHLDTVDMGEKVGCCMSIVVCNRGGKADDDKCQQVGLSPRPSP